MAKGKYHKWLEPDNLTRLAAWCRDGLTDEQIARNMGIATSTLYNWKRDHVEIMEALKKGKEVVDIEVENALFKRAMGYEYEETTEEAVFNKATKEWEMVVTRKQRKTVPPDVTAQIFWLKNRLPDKWRDKKAVDMEATVSNPFEGVSTEDIKKLIRDG